MTTSRIEDPRQEDLCRSTASDRSRCSPLPSSRSRKGCWRSAATSRPSGSWRPIDPGSSPGSSPAVRSSGGRRTLGSSCSPMSSGSRAGSPGRSARAASKRATIPPSPTSSGPAPRLLAGTRTGTWITPEMQRAYIRLHQLGHAHSMESWRDGRLVGGIYGVRVGRVFCGESMFHHETDASKVAPRGPGRAAEARGGRPRSIARSRAST